MDLKEIEKKLIRGVAEIMTLDESELTAESTLADLGVDSLALVEIFVLIENEFNLKLLDAGLKKDDIFSIGSLASYIAQTMRDRKKA